MKMKFQTMNIGNYGVPDEGKEKNLRSKAIDLALVLLGMVFLYLGSR